MKHDVAAQESLAAAVFALADDLPLPTVLALVATLEKAPTLAVARQRLAMMPNAEFRARATQFFAEWERCAPDVPSSAVVLALRTAGLAAHPHRNRQTIEAVWTGPEPATPFRRTEQAILQLLDGATANVTVVSYAVYRIPHVCDALLRAARRGVRLTVIIETPDLLEGENEYSTLKALGPEVAAVASVYYWPAEQRAKSVKGKLGILHVKCVVADARWLFLSSANLTSYAFDINMELGLLITGGPLPKQVQVNFDNLIANGVLQRIRAV